MIFKGCCTALITPFKDDGIDFGQMENLLEFQISNGIDALLVLGTTGEPVTMSDKEKAEVITFAKKVINGRVPMIVGTGSNSTDGCADASKDAEKLGADALLVVTPYYNKATQNGLVQHYNKVADAVGIPIIAYNVPGRTGVNMLPPTYARICEHKNIVGMKEACGNIEQISEMIRLTYGKAEMYSGDDPIAVPVMAMGGKGLISVMSNVAPKFTVEMIAKCLEGDFASARDMQLRALPLIKALMALEVNPIGIKCASKLTGLTNGMVRLPLTEMEDANELILKNAMVEFGIL
jgi:4-hydroxy-tetrahydrodipicolinate synthase